MEGADFLLGKFGALENIAQVSDHVVLLFRREEEIAFGQLGLQVLKELEELAKGLRV